MTGFVQRLAVDPSYEGLGVGSALLQDGLSWLARHRVDSILVNTHLDNHRALALYRRWGFHQVDQHLQVLEWSNRLRESS
jgi:ribosomal protein S18 acetylase RimI-like enzyme